MVNGGEFIGCQLEPGHAGGHEVRFVWRNHAEDGIWSLGDAPSPKPPLIIVNSDGGVGGWRIYQPKEGFGRDLFEPGEEGCRHEERRYELACVSAGNFWDAAALLEQMERGR